MIESKADIALRLALHGSASDRFGVAGSGRRDSWRRLKKSPTNVEQRPFGQMTGHGRTP